MHVRIQPNISRYVPHIFWQVPDIFMVCATYFKAYGMLITIPVGCFVPVCMSFYLFIFYYVISTVFGSTEHFVSYVFFFVFFLGILCFVHCKYGNSVF